MNQFLIIFPLFCSWFKDDIDEQFQEVDALDEDIDMDG
jgi:hypothetical protein